MSFSRAVQAGALPRSQSPWPETPAGDASSLRPAEGAELFSFDHFEGEPQLFRGAQLNDGGALGKGAPPR